MGSVQFTKSKHNRTNNAEGCARYLSKYLTKHPTKGYPGATAGCARVSKSRAEALNANPGNFYVNVHTAALPNGAVRGQLFARSR